MAVTTRAVRQQAPASTGNQDYTVSGFGTPTACYVFVSGGGAADTDVDNAFFGHGFYDGTNQRSICGVSISGVTATSTTRAGKGIHNSYAVYVWDQAGSNTRQASASFITDGVRLNWSGDTTWRPYVTVVLFKGCGAVVGNSQAATLPTTSTVDVSTSGITPDLVFIANVGGTSAQTQSQSDLHVFGVACDDGGGAPYPQACVYHNDQATGAASTACYGRLDSANASLYIGGSSTTQSYSVTAFAADQFTLTTSGADATGRAFIFMALSTGGEASVFQVATPTGSGDWSPSLCTGTPSSVMMWTTALTSVDSTAGADPGASGYGFYYVNSTTSDEDFGHYNVSDDAASTSDTSGRLSAKLVIQDGIAGTPLFDAVSPSFVSGGLTFSDANVTQGASAYQIFGVAFASATSNKGRMLMLGVG